MPKYEIGKITRVYKPYLDTDGTIVRNVAAELPEITITNDIHHKDWSNHNRKNAVITADTRDRDYVKQQRAQREFNALVDKAKSDYAMSNFLLSTSNIRPVNGKY